MIWHGARQVRQKVDVAAIEADKTDYFGNQVKRFFELPLCSCVTVTVSVNVSVFLVLSVHPAVCPCQKL